MAGAGATLDAVHDRARSAGWAYGVDLTARDSATVDGTIATNAGGEHTVHYGPTRAQVVSVDAVLADGSVTGGVEGGTDALDDAILRLVTEHQGSIAAEHGVGTAKARYLPLTSCEADLEARRRIKRRARPPGTSSIPG